MQGDSHVRVRMTINPALRPNRNCDTQLLLDLSMQTTRQILPGFKFSARKFPHPTQQTLRRPLRNQHAPVLIDYGRRHRDMR